MGLLDSLSKLFVPDLQARTLEFPSFDNQIDALWWRKINRSGFRTPTASEALGVPAIFGAVSLIADTVGSLSLEAYRQGLLLEQGDTPRLVQRPNPFSTPRAFFRDTAFHIATRGEAWWWVAARDTDDAPLSLFPVPPWEITVAANDDNRLQPTVTWGDRVLPNRDIRHITYLPARDGLRGVGPLQLCGAAISVSVEADEWAANFFSGSVPSIVGKTAQDLTEDELALMDAQWNEKPPNLPRWLTNGLELEESPYDAGKAQLTESRQHQVGEVARMFNMPGALIEYQMGGSSLTYQNQENIWSDFQRRCLSPHFLEPIEQEMSDLLTRSTAARFNLKQLLRADPKTRAEVYAQLVPLGIMSPDEARQAEGFAPGSVDFASTPLQTPAATPDRLPPDATRTRAAGDFRCERCHLKLADAAGPGTAITCRRCKTPNRVADEAPALPYVLAERSEPANVTVNPANVTVHPTPAPALSFSMPEKVSFSADPVQMLAPESVPQIWNEDMMARFEKAMAPKVRRIVRDKAGRMVSVIEEAS